MNLRVLLNIWFGFTVVISLFSLVFSLKFESGVSFKSFIINIIYITLFYIVISNQLRSKNFEKSKLVILILIFSFLFLFIFKLLYFNDSSSFFEFSAVDSLQYHNFALKVNEEGFIDGINSFANQEDIEDLGAVFFMSLSYLIYPSPISFNVFNVLAGTITLIYVYKLALDYMSKEFAFIMSIIYGLSSFVIYLYSTGMKETFFVMFVVLFFTKLSEFIKTKKIGSLILCLIFLGSIYFFRPAVMYMLIVSVLLGLIFSNSKGVLGILISVIIVTVAIGFLMKDFVNLKDRYYTNEDAIEERVSSAGIKADTFSYVASFLSGTIGPLPSYAPQEGRLQQYFYSFGLGLKVYLSVFFWLGLLYVLRKKNILLISICMFAVFEIISLSAILQSFELRFNSPHLIFVYFIAFYWLYQKANLMNVRKIEKRIIPMYMIVSTLIIIYWNSRLFT